MAFKMKSSPYQKESRWAKFKGKVKEHAGRVSDITDPKYSWGPVDYVKKAAEKARNHYDPKYKDYRSGEKVRPIDKKDKNKQLVEKK